MGAPRRGWEGVGDPLPLSSFSQEALRGSGYIGQARPQGVTPSFESVLSDLCLLCELKNMPRRTLGSLASDINIAGAEAVNRTVGPELTHVERQCVRMYERRHEVWRTLNRDRVAAFLELFLMAMVRLENARRDGLRLPSTARVLIETLRNRIIPTCVDDG